MLSIDFGNKNLHLVDGKYVGDKIEITAGAIVPMPKELVVDGIFSNPVELSHFVSNILSENKIISKEAIITINSGNAVIRDFEFPNSKPQELTAMVHNEMEQVVTSAQNNIIDYKVLSEIDNGKKVKVRAAAIRRELVESAYKFLTAIKLKPVSLDIHSNAISKLFTDGIKINDNVYGKDYSTLLVDFGFTSTNIYILAAGGIDFNRTIQLGGRELEAVLLKGQGELKEKLNLKSIDGQDSEAADRAKVFLTRWTDELYKVMQYFNTRTAVASIKSILLFGGDSNIEGLCDYIGSMFSVSCEVINNIDKVKPIKRQKELPLSMLINAIGAMVKI